MKNFGEGKKWIAGIVVKKIGNVNYHVVLCGTNKILHRHVDQLISRVPSLGVSEEATQLGPERTNELPGHNEHGTQEELRRSGRVRERPVWTKDYEL